MADWSRLSELVDELLDRMAVATVINTAALKEAANLMETMTGTLSRPA